MTLLQGAGLGCRITNVTRDHPSIVVKRWKGMMTIHVTMKWLFVKSNVHAFRALQLPSVPPLQKNVQGMF